MKLELCQPVEMVTAAEGEAPSRTIMGLAVPWNTTAYASTGPVRFLPGSIPVDGPAPKLIRNHDLAEPIGIVTERVATDDGVLFSARISATGAGDEALTLAADGVLDAVSVGVDVLDHEFDGNVMVVKASRWRELSMVTFGAFDSARIHQVAAEADPEPIDPDNQPETETETETEMEAPVSEATIPTNPIVVANAAPITVRPRITAGEYLSAMITGRPVPEVRAADNELADIPGLLPQILTGDVWNTQTARRPIIDAVGTRALPQYGSSFDRRYIATHTSVAQQAAEFNSLSSTAMVVNKQQFDKKTFGGYVNVSSQAGDWSEPALVQALIEDMVRQYARATEAYVATRIAAVYAQATDTIASFVDGDDVIAAIYSGAAEMYQSTDVMPTHMIVSSTVWAEMGQAKTAGGDYIFPYLNPSNAAGQYTSGAAVMNGNPLGLALIVSDDLSANPTECVLLYAPALEVYEDRSRTGGIRVENPATASATLGLWGYIAADLINPTPLANCPYALSLT